MILAPFAMSTLVGGQEIERSFYAWMRTFLLNAFEIVVIALTMVISFKLIGAGISLFDGKNIVTSMVDGFWDALNSLFTMILVTAAVKVQCFLIKSIWSINVPKFGTERRSYESKKYHNGCHSVYRTGTCARNQYTGENKEM